MSDPPRPKPGSLRDRIAAFENKGPAQAAPAPPAPRPKPREWKPKPVATSPPGSPSATPDAAVTSSATPEEPHGARKVGGMSASDAKESIGMGGSLKERMAALKGMGAFGGAPPAEPPPRPSGDKPKWKPPPKVPHVPAVGDHEEDAGEATVTSPSLAPVSAEGSLKSPPAVEVGDPMSAAADDEAGEKEQDPEEEERQRRAAIAARMAKLGGARVGMGPPIFGKKPAVPAKKPSLEVNRGELPAAKAEVEHPAHKVDEEPISVTGKAAEPGEEPTGRKDSDVTSIVSPPPTDIEAPIVSPKPQTSSPLDTAISAPIPIPASQSTTSLTVPCDDADSTHTSSSAATRSPSMPVPAAPKRAAPPRRKAKSPAPPSAAVTPAAEEVPKELGESVVVAEGKNVEGEEDKKVVGEDAQHEGEAGSTSVTVDHPEETQAVLSTTPAPNSTHAPTEPAVSPPTTNAATADKDEETVLRGPLHTSPGVTLLAGVRSAVNTVADAVGVQGLDGGDREPEVGQVGRSVEQITGSDNEDVAVPAEGSTPASIPPPPQRTTSTSSDPRPESPDVPEVDVARKVEAPHEPESEAKPLPETELDAVKDQEHTADIEPVGVGRSGDVVEEKEYNVAEEAIVPDVEDVIPEEQKAEGAAEAPEEEGEESEEARRQRIAERVAKMGGFNPFGAPPRPGGVPALTSPGTSRKASVNVEETELSPREEKRQNSGMSGMGIPPAVRRKTKDDIEMEAEPEEDDRQRQPDIHARSTHDNIDSEDAEIDDTTPGIDEDGYEHKHTASYIPPPLQQDHNRDIAERDEEEVESAHDQVPVPVSATQRPRVHTLDSDAAPSSHARSPIHPPPPPPILPPHPEPEEESYEDAVEEQEQVEEDLESEIAPPKITRALPPAPGFGGPPPPPHASRPAVEQSPIEGSFLPQVSSEEEEEEAVPPPPPKRTSLPPPARTVPAPIAPPIPEADDDEEYMQEVQEPEEEEEVAPPPPPRSAGKRTSMPPPARAAPTPGLPPPPVAQEQDKEEERANEKEVLDDEDGDPIDPQFHSPPSRASSMQGHVPHLSLTAALAGSGGITDSQQYQSPVHTSPPSSPPTSTTGRRTSGAQRTMSPPPLSATSPISPHPALAPETQSGSQEDEEQTRRRTIAERMAKLGGIRFGAPPPPPPMRRPPATEEAPASAEEVSHGHPEGEVEPRAEAEESQQEETEEDEQARRQRIAAKIAGMGGMRFGMLPSQAAPARPPPTHKDVEEDEPAPPPPPARAVPPPVRAPPPPQRLDSEYENVSASEDDDGVEVEAEESEAEEVRHEELSTEYEEDSVGPEEEEAPPPPPPRSGRPPVPTGRPPVPVGIGRPSDPSAARSPVRRGSHDTVTSIGSRHAPPSAQHAPQSDFVMVEQDEDEAPPPPPPPRQSRPPQPRSAPVPPPPPQVQSPGVPEKEMGQWELPSIPSGGLDFGDGGATSDLSASMWSEDSTAYPSTASHPAPPQQQAQRQSLSSPAHPLPPAPSASGTTGVAPIPAEMSSIDLQAVWGRVGVQICEVAATLHEKSKKTLIGNGSYAGFVSAVLAQVPNARVSPATQSGEWNEYGYLIYSQSGTAVQVRASEIMPGDIIVLEEAKLKGHKGLHAYNVMVGGAGAEACVGVVSEFEGKKMKVRALLANQHVGQSTVESVSYKLEDMKSGMIKVYRVLEA